MVQTTEKVRTVKTVKPNGVILYRGPSMLNGEEIVVIATGIGRKSKNPKTGNMVQTYILYVEQDPMTAKDNGRDEAVCGNCPHRGRKEWDEKAKRFRMKGATCYVNVVQGPLAVWKAWKAGSYAKFNPRRHLSLFSGRLIRFGTYGDPAAAPLWVWELLQSEASNHTGYTHQWRHCDPRFARYVMASCETPAERREAMAKGYRTFRVRLEGEPLEMGEFVCPASQEAGKRLTCAECKACSGAKDAGTNATPAIVFHGSHIANDWVFKAFVKTRDHIAANERSRGLIPLSLVN